MIYDDIKNFNKQFEYEPRIENAARLKKFSKFVICGMGGSHLAGDLLQVWRPELDLIVWPNYGLPPAKDLKERLIIVSSYSGNTEEAIDAFSQAKKHSFGVAVVASGGKLLKAAVERKAPYVAIPDIHVQPRLAVGLSIKATLALMGERKALAELSELAHKLKPGRYEEPGRNLAKTLHGSVPLIYSSLHNFPIAYNWKIKFNETGKIPAFCNFFPELNHNEMTGFDVAHATAALSHRFHFVFLKDQDNDRKIIRRMTVMEGILHKRGFKIDVVFIHGANIWEKIFNALILADWAAYYTATLYNVEAEQVPMVDEFKKLIK
ncbi:MAG: SIS domain-containing protein [Patescibacteria group bacterium]